MISAVSPCDIFIMLSFSYRRSGVTMSTQLKSQENAQILRVIKLKYVKRLSLFLKNDGVPTLAFRISYSMITRYTKMAGCFIAKEPHHMGTWINQYFNVFLSNT